MNNALKLLIAAASIVVTTAGGYWLWSQASERHASEDAGVFSAARSVCLGKIRDLNMGAYKVRPDVDACLKSGHLTIEDEQAAEKITGSSSQ